MKTKINFFKMAFLLGAILLYENSNAQSATSKKIVVGVLNIDSKGLSMQPDQMGNLLRIELDKLDTFDVIDRYDAMYLIEKNKMDISNCYGKICLVENGKLLNADKMLGGSVELIGESIIITLRLINVQNFSTEKTVVKEFLNLPEEIQNMVSISLREVFNLKNNEELVTRLTKKFNYENLTNNPKSEKLKLNGPRLGFIYYFGNNAKRLHESTTTGGYDAIPIMFQFGYQFEKQYLNEGNFQALFEVVPMITGLDQGFFIPSITVMHGLRNNKWGWEFAFGPTFGINTFKKGFYRNGEWITDNDEIYKNKNNYDIIERQDSRGYTKVTTGFIFACGKTFKSGKLNIPVNTWIRPDKNGIMAGASFGFNAKKDKPKFK